MNIGKRAKIMVASLGLVGAGALGASAFTATGLNNQAGSAHFLGGAIEQSVTGATLMSTNYVFHDATNEAVDEVDLAFDAPAAGQYVKVVFHQGVTDTTATSVSTDAIPVSDKVGDALETGYGVKATVSSLTGVTGITVTVSETVIP
jgi:hypothetical protein